GVADGQPVNDVRWGVGNTPVFATTVSEACGYDCDRRIICEMCSQGSDHCCLLSEKGRVPEDRDGGEHSVIKEREEGATLVPNGSRDPGRYRCLGANSQHYPLARCGRP